MCKTGLTDLVAITPVFVMSSLCLGVLVRITRCYGNGYQFARAGNVSVVKK